MKIRINLAAIAVYCFITAIMFIAGMSMGGPGMFILYLMIIYPVLSIIQFIINVIRIRFYEEFDREKPAKGETVKYGLIFANESLFFNPLTFVNFNYMRSNIIQNNKLMHISLPPKTTVKKNFDINCPYRGIYKVGISELYQKDLLKFLTFYNNVWYRTFCVYPKIINIDRFFPSTHIDNFAKGSISGSNTDNTMFLSVSEYRNGDSAKNIFWKKLAATGLPLIKNFEKTSYPGIDIFLDLRRDDEDDETILQKEDCSMEILVAAAKYLFDSGIPVSVFMDIDHEKNLLSSNNYLFGDLYQMTMSVYFKPDYSGSRLFNILFEKNLNSHNTVLFIIHKIDYDIIDIISRLNGEMTFFCIFNLTGFTGIIKNEAEAFIKKINDYGCYVKTVSSGKTIKEELEL